MHFGSCSFKFISSLTFPMNFRRSLISSVLLLTVQFVLGQEDEVHDHHDDFKRFRAAMLIGHAFSPEANTETSSFLLIPTYGFDIQYWFSPKWGVALKNDIEIASYLVEYKSGESNEIERKYPLIIAVPVLFSPWGKNHFTFILGPGVEVDSNRSFSVFRMGVGSEFNIGGDWDFAPEIIYDLKNGHINTLTLALGIGKRF